MVGQVNVRAGPIAGGTLMLESGLSGTKGQSAKAGTAGSRCSSGTGPIVSTAKRYKAQIRHRPQKQNLSKLRLVL